MSKVLIGRQSLALIGRSSGMESFTEDSPEARQVALWYDPSRQESLSSYNFSFNRKTLALAAHTEAPTDNWAFRYVYPANCLHVWKIFSESSKKAQPFEISLVGEEKTILTNTEQAYAQYGFDLQITELFSASFTRALRYLVAHYMAPNLAGEVGIKLSDSLLKSHVAFLNKAATEDANGELDREEEDPSTVRVR